MMAIRRATLGLLLVLGAVLIGQSCIQRREFQLLKTTFTERPGLTIISGCESVVSRR